MEAWCGLGYLDRAVQENMKALNWPENNRNIRAPRLREQSKMRGRFRADLIAQHEKLRRRVEQELKRPNPRLNGGPVAETAVSASQTR